MFEGGGRGDTEHEYERDEVGHERAVLNRRLQLCTELLNVREKKVTHFVCEF